MEKIYQIAWFFLFCTLIAGCEKTVENKKTDLVDSSISDKIDQYIAGHVANNKFNGGLLVAKGDSIVYSKSFGLANRELGIDNAPSTKFLIGSITKPFTAYGILLLENQGRLSLDDKLSTYFPDFPDANKVTVKHLLTHTSGIKDYHAFSDWKEKSKLSVTPQTTLIDVAKDPFIFDPGARFSYSNSGYILLGLLIEQVSGESFEASIQHEILDPLALTRTGIINNEKIVSNLASGYTTSPRESKKAAYINYNQPFASGNMYSTPTDLWKFTQAVVNSKLLPIEKTEAIFNVSESYGYGWGIRNYNGVKAYGHHGAMNGFVGSITYIPDEEYFICLLTNDDNTPEHTISEDLAAIIKGKDVPPPSQTKLIDLSQEMIQAVTGDYLIKPGDTLSVYTDENRLYLHETGQVRHELFPFNTFQFSFMLFEFHAVFSDLKEGKSQTLRFVGRSNVVARRVTKSQKIK